MNYQEIENMVGKYNKEDFPLCGTNEDWENIIIYIRKDENGKYFEVISDLNTNLYNSVELVRKYYENGDVEDC